MFSFIIRKNSSKKVTGVSAGRWQRRTSQDRADWEINVTVGGAVEPNVIYVVFSEARKSYSCGWLFHRAAPAATGLKCDSEKMAVSADHTRH